MPGGIAIPQIPQVLNVPIGGVVAWLKSYTNTPALPAGWVECNGQALSDPESVYNGQTIPNLNGQNRFLRGNSTSGGVGGLDTVTLSVAQMPAHTHQITQLSPQFDGSAKNLEGLPSDGDDTHPVITNSAGNSQPHENKPPYYDVVWIMRVK